MSGRAEDWMAAHWADWFHTTDPLMMVKLSKTNGRLTKDKQAQIMWAMLGEMDVKHPEWGQLFSAHQDASIWSKKSGSLLRFQGPLLERIREIQKGYSWHDAMPFRIFSRALTGDFSRFLDEVNDSHFKVHFCDVVRDALPSPRCPDPNPEIVAFLKSGPSPFPETKEIEGEWNSRFWADWLESAPIPEGLLDRSDWSSFRSHALEHARSGTHGSACWIKNLLTKNDY